MSEPISLDAEQALLGAILFDNQIHERVGSFLKTEHFYDPIHQLIYETITGLLKQGRHVSPVIVDGALMGSSGYREANGAEYLKAMAANVPSLAGAPDYARLIVELSTRRGLVSVGNEIAERARASSFDDDPKTQIMEAEEALGALAAEDVRQIETIKSATINWIERMTRVNSGEETPGISCGLSDLDKMLGGFKPEGLYIVAARPSMGKTSAALALAKGFARNGYGVFFASLEMDSGGLISRVVSDFVRETGARLPYASIEGGLVDENDIGLVSDAAQRVFELPLIFDTMENASAARIRQSAKQAKRRFENEGRKLGAVVVDYIGLMSASGRLSNKVEIEGEKALQLKTLARELRCPVIALCQLSREVEKRDDKRPQLSDLRWSGDIEAHADVVMLLYRPAYYVKKAEPKYGTPDYIDWEIEMREVERQLFWLVDKNRQGRVGTVESSCEIETSAIRDKGFPWFRMEPQPSQESMAL